MDKYLRAMSIYAGIWFFASLINAGISTLYIILSSHEVNGIMIIFFFLSVFFSFLLSIPVLFIAMILSLFLLRIKAWPNAFQLVLLVTFVVAIAGAVFFKDFLTEINSTPLFLCISIVVSAVSAVIIFQDKLKAIDTMEE
ncbi:hypothetical protein [Ferruginibacter sp. SUN106]|uniref:hypothetical protein n=1 Tax=Ferruginibacter sp. SUN106 TaxID=2978348 RepID=UPI003D36F565